MAAISLVQCVSWLFFVFSALLFAFMFRFNYMHARPYEPSEVPHKDGLLAAALGFRTAPALHILGYCIFGIFVNLKSRPVGMLGNSRRREASNFFCRKKREVRGSQHFISRSIYMHFCKYLHTVFLCFLSLCITSAERCPFLLQHFLQHAFKASCTAFYSCPRLDSPGKINSVGGSSVITIGETPKPDREPVLVEKIKPWAGHDSGIKDYRKDYDYSDVSCSEKRTGATGAALRSASADLCAATCAVIRAATCKDRLRPPGIRQSFFGRAHASTQTHLKRLPVAWPFHFRSSSASPTFF